MRPRTLAVEVSGMGEAGQRLINRNPVSQVQQGARARQGGGVL